MGQENLFSAMWHCREFRTSDCLEWCTTQGYNQRMTRIPITLFSETISVYCHAAGGLL